MSKEYLSHRIARDAAFEAPTVGSVNLQVRTGASVPFQPHMLDGSSPSVTDVNLQVRTGASVPFQPHMLDKGDLAAAPTVADVNLQVRTGASVPFASYMVAEPKAPATDPNKAVTARKTK
jgi:hypothetical protein